MGLKTDLDLALEDKEDAIKVDVTVASWVFLFLRQVEEDSQENGVMILGEGSSMTLDRLSSSNETFLGVMKLVGLTFLEEVSC